MSGALMETLVLQSDMYLNIPTAIPVLISALAIFVLGIFVLIREKASRISFSFLAVTLSMGFWLFCFFGMYISSAKEVAMFWAKIAYLGVLSIPSTIYQFTVEVLGLTSQRKRWLYSSWICSLFFICLNLFSDKLIPDLYQYSWGYYPKYGWLSLPYLVFFFGMMIFTLREYWASYRNAKPGDFKSRTLWLTIAFGIVYLGSFDFLAKFGIPLYPFGYFPVLCFVTVVARTVLRWNLVDITASFAAKQVLKTMSEPLLVCDERGTICVVNQAACSLTGYSEKELVGAPFYQFLKQMKILSSKELNEMNWLFLHGKEMDLIAKGGGTIDIMISASEIWHENLKLVGYVFVAKDMREIKKVHHALKQAHDHLEKKVVERTEELKISNEKLQKEMQEHERANEQFRTVVENAPNAIIMVDETGKICLVNRQTETLFGYTYDELRGNTIEMLIPERFRNAHLGHRSGFFKDPHSRAMGAGRDLFGLHKDGREIPVEIGLTSLRMSDGFFVLASVIDITERKRLERMKSEFLSSISHELKTPLTSINSSLSLVESTGGKSLPDEVKRLVDIGLRNCERMNRLIGDILDVQKMEAGLIEFIMKPANLNVLVEYAIKSLSYIARENKNEIILINKAKDAYVHGDSDRLTQVMNNLLANAIKFSDQGEKVTVSVERIDKSLRIAVNNVGPVIPEEFRDRIFQKFSQANMSDARMKAGTGLGLWISKSIVERHGGQIYYESTREKGTTFYLDIPEWAGGTALTSDTIVDNGHKALVCEDEHDFAILLSLMLNEMGFETEIASTAQQAKEKLSKGVFRLMTLDVALPDQDGISLARELRNQEKTKSLPIVIVSVKAYQARFESRKENLGIKAWLEKPVDRGQLSEIMKGLTL